MRPLLLLGNFFIIYLWSAPRTMEEQNLNRTEQKGWANKRGTTLWSSLNNGEPKPEQKGWAY
jgi:hypothetical protein